MRLRKNVISINESIIGHEISNLTIFVRVKVVKVHVYIGRIKSAGYVYYKVNYFCRIVDNISKKKKPIKRAQ